MIIIGIITFPYTFSGRKIGEIVIGVIFWLIFDLFIYLGFVVIHAVSTTNLRACSARGRETDKEKE